MGDPFIEGEVESLAFNLLFDEKKPIKDAGLEMRQRGYEITDHALQKFRDEIFSRLMKDNNRDKFAGSLLNSIDKITVEFDDLYERTKRLVTKLESEGKDYEAMIGIRELREQMTVALKRLGEFKVAITKIQAEKVNIINTHEFINAMGQTQESWFESMDAEIAGDKLVFNKPRAEVIESYRIWSSRKKLGGKTSQDI
jgi:hypothetical protein